MFKLPQVFLNTLKTNNRSFMIKYNTKCLKSTVAEISKTQNIFDSDTEEDQVRMKQPGQSVGKIQSSMVAAAFAALHPSNSTESNIKTPFTDDKIDKASNVNELLSISEGNGVSRRHALKVVSTLADWSSSGKVKLSDFENDARFIKLCRILTKGNKINRNTLPKSEDLSTVLNVTADDEAARLVANLTLPQIVKVMTALSQKRRRSVVLLRSLAYNITSSSDHLNLKESADLLYSMCILNFHDDNLLGKIVGDIGLHLGEVLQTSSAIGSIVTSLGLLKYKNCDILDGLSEWVLTNKSTCRPQDVFSLFVTLAILNHTPANSGQLYSTFIPQLIEAETRKPIEWLNTVWALVLLGQASSNHISSVLIDEFVNKVEGNGGLSTSLKMKFLNINGAALYLLKNYNGPTFSPTSEMYSVNMGKTKEKNELVEAVVDTLKNLIQLEDHLNVNVNTNCGFLIDAYCILDPKCNPLPINKGNEARNDVKRVAVQVYDYHDMCRGKIEPTGAKIFSRKLLESQNYKILAVPYTEFKITDKLVHRVQYLEMKLKEIVK